MPWNFQGEPIRAEKTALNGPEIGNSYIQNTIRPQHSRGFCAGGPWLRDMFQDMVDDDEIKGFVWPRERGSLCSVAVQPFVVDRQRATLNIDTRRTPTKGLESPEEIAPPAADIKNARPPRAMRCRRRRSRRR